MGIQEEINEDVDRAAEISQDNPADCEMVLLVRE
jgi:hypothetical protein